MGEATLLFMIWYTALGCMRGQKNCKLKKLKSHKTRIRHHHLESLPLIESEPNFAGNVITQAKF